MILSLRNSRLLGLAFLVLALALPLSGQDTPRVKSSSVSVSGTVTTVSGNLITILDGMISIDATGAVFHRRRGPASIADVKPGMRIIAAISNADAPVGATLQAVSVTIVDLPDGTLTGPVQAVDLAASTITLAGARVQVTPETRIIAGRSDTGKTLADIKVGDLVRTEVQLSQGGLVAVQIVLLPPRPDAIVGTVKSITPTQWVINADGTEITIVVNEQTKIEGSPKVGDMVRALVIRDATGSLVAVGIFLSRPIPSPGTSLRGVVKGIGPASWIITTANGDVTVIVNAQTKIEPGLKVGDTVEVKGFPDATGATVAVSIRRARGR